MTFPFFLRPLPLLAGLLLTTAVRAQSPAPAAADYRPCGTDQAMRQALGAGYEAWQQQYRAQVQALSAARRNPPGSPPSGPRFIVPVVVHIIHDNGASNISDDQVYDAIEKTNLVYAELDPDTAQVIQYFKPRIGNANLEFRLARLDPNGNCTTGITRHVSPLTQAADDAVKNLPGARWNAQRYLNVWIVENIAIGAGGYAYFPCVSTQIDGIILRNAQFGSIGRSSPGCQLCVKSLPHEIGHYLGLPHTWGGSNTPGLASNCNDDDGIADTPNTIGAQGCNYNQPACPGDPSPIANVQNIMDYSSCPSMFTRGQTDVMNNGVNLGGFSCRQQLVSAANLQLTGVANGQVVGPCAPVAYFSATGAQATAAVQRICAGGSVSFRGDAYNVPLGTAVQYSWNFPGGQPATSTSQTPTVTYATPGTYNVEMSATNPIGTNSAVQTGYVRVQDVNMGLRPPTLETFDSPQVIINNPVPATQWETVPATGTTWEYTTTAATQGTGAVRLRLRLTVPDKNYDLVSPNVIVTNTLIRPYLYFKRAYAPTNSTNTDQLAVSISTDCGRSWVTRVVRSATTMALGSGAPTNTLFVPTPAQWRPDSLLLSAMLPAGSHLMIRFRATSDRGSALYLDDIRLKSRVVGLTADARATGARLSIYPNPSAEGEALIRLATGTTGAATLRLTDATGRRLGQPLTIGTTGADTERELPLRTLAGPLAAGVYVVELTTADGARLTQRALVY